MDAKKIFLSGYKNATENFYIDKITEPTKALKPHIHNYFQIYLRKLSIKIINIVSFFHHFHIFLG